MSEEIANLVKERDEANQELGKLKEKHQSDYDKYEKLNQELIEKNE